LGFNQPKFWRFSIEKREWSHPEVVLRLWLTSDDQSEPHFECGIKKMQYPRAIPDPNLTAGTQGGPNQLIGSLNPLPGDTLGCFAINVQTLVQLSVV